LFPGRDQREKGRKRRKGKVEGRKRSIILDVLSATETYTSLRSTGGKTFVIPRSLLADASTSTHVTDVDGTKLPVPSQLLGMFRIELKISLCARSN
jgi:hypothetical protein